MLLPQAKCERARVRAPPLPPLLQALRFGNSRGQVEEAVWLGFQMSPSGVNDAHKAEALHMLDMVSGAVGGQQAGRSSDSGTWQLGTALCGMAREQPQPALFLAQQHEGWVCRQEGLISGCLCYAAGGGQVPQGLCRPGLAARRHHPRPQQHQARPGASSRRACALSQLCPTYACALLTAAPQAPPCWRAAPA